MRNAAMIVAFAVLACAAFPQAIPERNATNAPTFAQRMTLNGALERRDSGLMLRTQSQSVPVHLGTLQRSTAVRRAVERGTDVQITGRMVTNKGRTILAADTVTIEGKTTRVRSAMGVVIPPEAWEVRR